MKKRWVLIILIPILAFGLLEWQTGLNSEPVNESTKKNTKPVIIQATQVDPRAGMRTKLGSFAADLDGDGAVETIELHTAAERAEDGQMAWDDGQNWVMAVEDGSEFYPIFQEYVQLGVVYFTVWSIWGADEEMPRITVIIDQNAGLRILNFSYDKEQKGYKAEEIYNPGGIVQMYNSFPHY